MVRARRVQCPRCLQSISPRSVSNLAFGTIGDQRASGVSLPAEDTISSIAPGLSPIQSLRRRRMWTITAAAVVVIAVVGVALAVHHKAHHPSIAVPPVHRTTTASLAHCPVSSTITMSEGQNAQGSYVVSVTGNAANARAASLANLEVSWVVIYADLSTGLPTTTLVDGGNLLTKGESAAWSATASTNDGMVPPTSVRVVGISYNHDAGSC
jgi:hypothetical protein